MSQITSSGNGCDSTLTRSASPCSQNWSSTSEQIVSTESSTPCNCRGVNERDTMPRWRAWRGSSMLMNDPKNSSASGGRSGIDTAPLPEQKSFGRRLISTTSSKRVAAKKRSTSPLIGLSATISRNGSCSRSSANSSMRSASGQLPEVLLDETSRSQSGHQRAPSGCRGQHQRTHLVVVEGGRGSSRPAVAPSQRRARSRRGRARPTRRGTTRGRPARPADGRSTRRLDRLRTTRRRDSRYRRPRRCSSHTCTLHAPPRCVPKKFQICFHPSLAASTRYEGRSTEKNACPASS